MSSYSRYMYLMIFYNVHILVLPTGKGMYSLKL